MRQLVTKEEIEIALDKVLSHMKKILQNKGENSFASMHEARGVIEEEIDELRLAFRGNNWGEIEYEMLDVIVPCVFTIACMINHKLEW